MGLAELEASISKTEWCWRQESNPRPTDYKSAALPTELRQHQARILGRLSSRCKHTLSGGAAAFDALQRTAIATGLRP